MLRTLTLFLLWQNNNQAVKGLKGRLTASNCSKHTEEERERR